MLKGKKIIVGISGGIAAYKICSLVRLLIRQGAEVRVIMTPSAVKFVSPLTLSVLSQNEVVVNMFSETDPSKTETVKAGTWHITNGMWADLFVLAPATANTLAKINAGISDNFLLSAVLAARCPVALVPTMDEDMFRNKITQKNISDLKKYGYRVLDPVVGELASGLYGEGKMPEPEAILGFISAQFIKKDLSGKKILVTAGPTVEPVDSVRYISNYSSGKMGFEIARAALERGADVTLIAGPVSIEAPGGVKFVGVKTTGEMSAQVKKHSKGKNLIVMSAAVSDFRPKRVTEGKIKKENASLFIELEKTEDILKYLGRNKKGYKLFGFALETDNQIENAKRKLKEKNLDLIVLNDPNVKGAGFGTGTNVVTLIDKKSVTPLPLMSKYEAANKILDVFVNKKIK